MVLAFPGHLSVLSYVPPLPSTPRGRTTAQLLRGGICGTWRKTAMPSGNDTIMLILGDLDILGKTTAYGASCTYDRAMRTAIESGAAGVVFALDGPEVPGFTWGYGRIPDDATGWDLNLPYCFATTEDIVALTKAAAVDLAVHVTIDQQRNRCVAGAGERPGGYGT